MANNIRLLQLRTSTDNSDQVVTYGTTDTEPTSHEREEEKSLISKFKGMLFAVLAGFAFTTANVGAKSLMNKEPADLTFMMGLSTVVYMFPFLVMSGTAKLGVDKKFYFLAVLLGVFTTLNCFTRYSALKLIPIGVASVITFNTPFFVIIIARIALKEKISRLAVGSMFVMLFGLCLVVKLPEIIMQMNARGALDTQALVGCGYALAALLSMSFAFVLLRKLCYVNSEFVTMFYGGLIAIFIAIFSPLSGGLTFQNDCSNTSWIYVATGFMGVLSNFLCVLANKYEEAGITSLVVLATDVVLGFLSQVFIFGDYVDAYSASGAILVCLSAFTLPARKWIMSLPEESELKRKFKWIEK